MPTTSASSIDESAALWRSWFDAASRPAVHRDLAGLYDRVDQAVADYGPTCWVSGRCCNFKQFDHLLYVTGLEIAWFTRQLREADTPAGQALRDFRQQCRNDPATPLPEACPLQLAGLCAAHAVRPLGCRIFFCQHGTQAWQHETYESFLNQLHQLHARHELPYRYMEWRAGLIEALRA